MPSTETIGLLSRCQHAILNIRSALSEKGQTVNNVPVENYPALIRNISGDADLINKTINSNGTYRASDDNADGYDVVNVNVTAEPDLQDKTVTSNGVYEADNNYDGLGKVTVNVTPRLQNKSVTDNGTYTADSGYDGLGEVEVDVEPDLETLNVSANGDYTPSAGKDGFNEVHVNVSGGAVLTGLTANNNGTYTPESGVDGYNRVDVNVTPTLEDKTITQNGTYTAGQGYDGLGEVVVNVSGGGQAVLQSIQIDNNGHYEPPTGVDGYNSIDVNVGNNSANRLLPLYFDIHNGYVNNLGIFVLDSTGVYSSDVYEVEANKHYMLYIDEASLNLLNVMYCNVDVTKASGVVNGTLINYSGDSKAYNCISFTPSADGYIVVTKSTSSLFYLLSSLYDMDDIINNSSSLISKYASNVEGYVDNGVWSADTNKYCDVFEVEANKTYAVFLGSTVGDDFDVMFTTTDITSASVASGTAINDSAASSYKLAMYNASANGYIVVSKGQGSNSINSYCVELDSFTSNNKGRNSNNKMLCLNSTQISRVLDIDDVNSRSDTSETCPVTSRTTLYDFGACYLEDYSSYGFILGDSNDSNLYKIDSDGAVEDTLSLSYAPADKPSATSNSYRIYYKDTSDKIAYYDMDDAEDNEYAVTLPNASDCVFVLLENSTEMLLYNNDTSDPGIYHSGDIGNNAFSKVSSENLGTIYQMIYDDYLVYAFGKNKLYIIDTSDNYSVSEYNIVNSKTINNVDVVFGSFKYNGAIYNIIDDVTTINSSGVQTTIKSGVNYDSDVFMVINGSIFSIDVDNSYEIYNSGGLVQQLTTSVKVPLNTKVVTYKGIPNIVHNSGDTYKTVTLTAKQSECNMTILDDEQVYFAERRNENVMVEKGMYVNNVLQGTTQRIAFPSDANGIISKQLV